MTWLTKINKNLKPKIMSRKIEESNALMGEAHNDVEYSSYNDHFETQTHLTIASMLRDKDKYAIVKIAVFLCGMGSFLTFMVTAAAPDYLLIAYPTNTNLIYLLVSIYNTANMIGLIIMLSPAGTYISIATRIKYGYILTSLFTFFIPAIPYLFYTEQHKIIMFILINGVISGLSSALLVTSLFSFAAMLPNDYLITAVSGQSVAGILSALIRIINKASFDTNNNGTILSGIGCFTIAGIIQLLAAVIFSIAFKSQFVDEYMLEYWAFKDSKYLEKCATNKEKPFISSNHNYDYASHLHGFIDPATTSTVATTSTIGASATTTNEEIDIEKIEMSIKTATTTQTISEIVSDFNILDGSRHLTTEESIERHRHLTYSKKQNWKHTKLNNNTRVSYSTVVQKIYKCLLSIFIGYGATYLVFPSLIVGLELNNEYLMTSNWSGVLLYLIWSICGWIGIVCARKFHCFTTYDNLWILQFMWMCTMYILFIVANQKLITNDIYTYTIVSISPLIFGFLSARTFAELPIRVGIDETEITQAITQLTLLTGILLGAWIAFAMNNLIPQ
eukprot:6122_1